MQVFLVKTNGLILAAYETESHAATHARTVTGAHVQMVETLSRVPASVYDDAASDDWDESMTPVQDHPSDITQTNPATPRAKAKSKPPKDR